MSEILRRFYSPSEQARVIEQSHRTARNKGWWKIEKGKAVVEDIHEKAVLIVSELAEAFEDYRNPKRDIKTIYALVGTGEVPWEPKHVETSPMPKPDGFPIEMADAYIRICDLAGALEVEELPELLIHTDGNTRSMGKIIYDIMECVFKVEDFDTHEDWFASLLAGIEGACRELGVDLHQAMALKAAYNETRPERHGGKRA